MAKSIPSSGSGAVRIILKNKDDFHYELRNKVEDENRVGYVYDVFYENVAGTLNMSVIDDEVRIASLNLGLGKVITLENDANLKKLCKFVLDSGK